MNYPDEDYVRFYTRDTVSWRALGWEGQTVLALMLHGKFDRSGVFDCDGHQPSHAVTLVTGLPDAVTGVGLKRLLDSKTWIVSDGKLVWPKFIEAQTCRRTDRARQEESRRNRRDSALGADGHKQSQRVTRRHTKSQPVTPSRAEQNQAEQNQAERETPAASPTRKTKSRKPSKPRETTLPTGFADKLTESQIAHAKSKGYLGWWAKNRFDSFCNAAKAKGLRYVDWDRALYNAWDRELNEWGNTPEKLAHLAPRGTATGPADPEAARRLADREARHQAEVEAHQRALADSLPAGAKPPGGVPALLRGIGG